MTRREEYEYEARVLAARILVVGDFSSREVTRLAQLVAWALAEERS